MSVERDPTEQPRIVGGIAGWPTPPDPAQQRSERSDSWGARVDASLRSHAAVAALTGLSDEVARLRARTSQLERRVAWLERLLVITAAIAVAALLGVLRSLG